MHEINEGDERYDNIGGDDVASVEEAEMKSSSDSINDNDGYLFSEFYASTCSGDSVYDIFKNEDEIITEYYNVWLNTNKRIRERRFNKIPYSGLPQDTNYLELLCIHTKNHERVLIKNFSREFTKKRIPLSTQKYKDGGVMEESVFDSTLKIRSQKIEMTTTEITDVAGTFFVKLSGLKTDNHF